MLFNEFITFDGKKNCKFTVEKGVVSAG